MKLTQESMQLERLVFLGKRFYTNKDALTERFGRIYQLPLEWSKRIGEVRCWLVDYHTRETVHVIDDALVIASTPVLSWGALKQLLYTCWGFRPNVVVASGDCYLGLLGWVIARICGAKLVFDIYDKYDDFGAYIRPLGFDTFGFLRHHTDLRLFASRALADSYCGELPEECDILVPNGVDDEQFRPLDAKAARSELDLPPRARIVGYFGGMEPDRGVSDLVAAVGRLQGERENIQLLICGKQHPATNLDHDWIIYRGMVPHVSMPLYINACDVVAVPYRRSSFMDMGASCKIVEYLMCGVPVVSSRTPNFVDNYPRQAVELMDCLFECGNVDDLERALCFQLDHGIVATTPHEIAWKRVAHDTLDAICKAIRMTPSVEHGLLGAP